MFCADGRTDGRTDRETDRQTDTETDRETEVWTEMSKPIAVFAYRNFANEPKNSFLRHTKHTGVYINNINRLKLLRGTGVICYDNHRNA